MPTIFQVSDSPRGPWDGSPKWTTREAVLDMCGDDCVAAFLDCGPGEPDWFIRHPDGRVERMSYVGESKGFVDGK